MIPLVFDAVCVVPGALLAEGEAAGGDVLAGEVVQGRCLRLVVLRHALKQVNYKTSLKS